MSFRTIIQKTLRISRHYSYNRIKTSILLIALFGLLVSCENDIEKIKKFANSKDLPSVTAEGFEMIISDSTIIRSKLQTPELIRHENEKEPYTEFPKGVVILQYDVKMNVTSNIKAQYAKYFEADQRWEAKNNVVAVNQKGDTLKTEYLIWNKKTGRISSNQFVKIIQKDQTFTGTGFDSNQSFTEYSFKNPKGIIYVDVQAK
jgi:LPS export ABC transporter protein LptC